MIKIRKIPIKIVCNCARSFATAVTQSGLISVLKIPPEGIPIIGCQSCSKTTIMPIPLSEIL